MVYQKTFKKSVDNFTKTMEKQYLKGLKKYNTELTTFNGRDSAQDLMDEIVDALQYATQLEMERNELCKIIYRGIAMDELPDYIQKYIERHGQ